MNYIFSIPPSNLDDSHTRRLFRAISHPIIIGIVLLVMSSTEAMAQDHITDTLTDNTNYRLQNIDDTTSYPIASIRSNLLLPLLNVGLDVPVNKRWSVGADYYYPWFWPAKSNKNCFELAFVSAEMRYWFNPNKEEIPDKNFLVGHSLATSVAWGYYDFERNYHGYQGNIWSASLDYVYALPISNDRLRLEFQLAVGAIWSPKAQPYNVYEEGGHLIREKGHHKNFFYFGPTKAGVSLVIPIYLKVKKMSTSSL